MSSPIIQSILSWRRRHFPTSREWAEDICNQFAATFSTKCLVCSYHRYGRSIGATDESEPEAHDCIEQQGGLEQEAKERMKGISAHYER